MEGWQIHNSFRGGNDRKLLPSRVYAPLRIKIENKNSLERPISIPFLTFSSFSFFFFKLCYDADKFEMSTIGKLQKKKDKNCRISRLSLSLVRNSTFRIYVSTNAATSISDIEQPIAFQRFLPYQKLSSISITIHPFRFLFLLLPPPATTRDQSKRVRQPSQKLRSQKLVRSMIG